MDLRVPHDLSAIVRDVRTAHAMSQEDVARRAVVARKTVNEIERGTSDPRLSNVLAILTALDITVILRLPGESSTESATSPPDLDDHLGGFDDD